MKIGNDKRGGSHGIVIGLSLIRMRFNLFSLEKMISERKKHKNFAKQKSDAMA